MRIVIDGYNLIRRIPELRECDHEDLERGRDALTRDLSVYGAGKRHRMTVVFDGIGGLHPGGGSGRVASVRVVFSPQGTSADRVIMSMCRDGQCDIVVSADREVVDAARLAGVTPVSPEAFWDRVQMEMYRRFKGEEVEEGDRGKGRGEGGRKLSKSQRRDRARIAKL